MKTLADIQRDVAAKSLDFRALDRLVKSDQFQAAFRRDPNNVLLKFAIGSGAIGMVKKWIEDVLTQELGELTIRQLRQRATKLGLNYVTSCTKGELIVRITQVINAGKPQETLESVSRIAVEHGTQDRDRPDDAGLPAQASG